MSGLQDCRKYEFAQNVNHHIGTERGKFIIYKITNIINNKIYIGQTYQSLNKRFKDHIKRVKHHAPCSIHRAMLKYGVCNFTIDAICYCHSKEDADDNEKRLIAEYASMDKRIGYNMTSGGEGSLNRSPGPDTRMKLRLANLGKKQSEEQRAKYDRKGINNPNWGKKHSPETIAKMSAKAKLRVGDKNPFFGKHHTDETRERWSKLRSGVTPMKGRKLASDECLDCTL